MSRLARQSFLGPTSDAILEAATIGLVGLGGGGSHLAQQAGHTEAGQALWRQQQQKLKAIDTLSERHRADEEAREQRQDQKTQDEFASRFNAAHHLDQK